MKKTRYSLLVSGLLLVCSGVPHAALYNYSDFSGGLGSDFSLDDDQGVFTLTTGTAGLRLTKAAGVGSGFTMAEVSWVHALVGNFYADIDYHLNQPLSNGQQVEWHVGTVDAPEQIFFDVRSNEAFLGATVSASNQR